MAEGIDVYTKFQAVTNWNSVRQAGKEFCYVKVSDGTSARPTNGYGPAGRSAGVLMGAYHYAQFGDATAQANLLCDRVVAEKLYDLAPALDLESPFTANQAAVDFSIAFLNRVKARGHRPAMYANQALLSTLISGISIRDRIKRAVPDAWIWCAKYSTNPPSVGHDVWQYTSGGTVPGISASAVDLNKGIIPVNNRPIPQPQKGQDMGTFIEGDLPLGKNKRFHRPVDVGANSAM